ncbi:MAG: glycosyltransferase [Alphaproteobacteria bacterium]|nr:glycosyltransferase [Alphaproteobacteria bacterium]
MAELVMAALRAAGHEPIRASSLRSYDGRGDRARQAALRDAGLAEATRLIDQWAGAPPAAWLTYHLYYKAPDWIGPAVAAALGIPYLVVEASHAPQRAGGAWDLGHRAVEHALKQAAAVFHLTRRDRAALVPLVAAPERLHFLLPFLDPAPFVATAGARAAHRAALAAAHGLDVGLPWLLVVAMMRPRDKLPSYRTLAAALATLTGRPWQLLIAGDGPARAAVAAAFASLGDARVRFLGLVPPAVLPQVYASANLFVWPALNEAFGMVFLEAQAAGLALVAGHSGGVEDTLIPGETGLLAPAAEPAAFAAVVAELLADPARRQRMGRAAAAFILRERNLGRAGAVLDAALRQAVGW